MEKRWFDSTLYDIFHELQVVSEEMDEIVEAISNNSKIRKILDKFDINEIKTHDDFIKWCKVLSENLDKNDLRKLIDKILAQEKKLNLNVFK